MAADAFAGGVLAAADPGRRRRIRRIWTNDRRRRRELERRRAWPPPTATCCGWALRNPFTDTPVKVVIDEAVELAKRFGGAQSAQFVNGILDKLMHQKETKCRT